jgi:hypothetical protein
MPFEARGLLPSRQSRIVLPVEVEASCPFAEWRILFQLPSPAFGVQRRGVSAISWRALGALPAPVTDCHRAAVMIRWVPTPRATCCARSARCTRCGRKGATIPAARMWVDCRRPCRSGRGVRCESSVGPPTPTCGLLQRKLPTHVAKLEAERLLAPHHARHGSMASYAN